MGFSPVEDARGADSSTRLAADRVRENIGDRVELRTRTDKQAGRMRQIEVRRQAREGPFDYCCPICGIELARSNCETFGGEYSCPYCGTQQRPSRVPARSR
jgi:predicted RNA-binding Zn-ribbon protein involved in translation (DUF1610 family)